MFFTAWQFAAAGAACAAIPVVIHLLNRRRYRVVQWAAMDFLQVAMKRNRRLIQIRDLLLLLLRVAAVLLFGLALARPYLASGRQQFSGDQPLHAILVLDNSLSMAYQRLEGTRLDIAKRRAREFVARLPAGSRISVLPLCGPDSAIERDPFRDTDRALEALDRIKPVDREASFSHAIDLARRAALADAELTPRVVLFSDQQRTNYRNLAAITDDDSLPAMQVVDVGDDDYENTWITDVRLQDGVADVKTPATIVVEVAHRGPSPRNNVPITLSVRGEIVASQVVSLDPSAGRREVVFQHVFDASDPSSTQPEFVPVHASLAPDRLPADDQRFRIAPVLTSLPVVFVDQYTAEQENPSLNRLGETRHLRRLLAPVSGETNRSFVEVRHVSIDDLTRSTLNDARLVVIAGVERPGPSADLLREYVEQGGQLLIAAGGEFDPAAWSEDAWRNGSGMLPLPLANASIGATPDEAGNSLATWSIAFESLGQHPFFYLADAPEETLRYLYAEPFFFKAVHVLSGSAVVDELRKTIRDELQRRFPAPTTNDAKTDASAGATSDPSATDPQLQANWLQWESPIPALDEREWPDDPDGHAAMIDQHVEQLLPRVLAQLDNDIQSPLLVERKMGRGRVLFFGSGLLSPWNTLPQTNAVVIFDRMLRSMIESTLPAHNFPAADRIVVPLPTADQQSSARLLRPGQEASPEPLNVGFVLRDQLGVEVVDALQRGTYKVLGGTRGESNATPPSDLLPDWNIDLAVNGPASESNWEPMTRAEFDAEAPGDKLSWVGTTQEISLEGGQLRARNAWWWFVLVVLLLLVVETGLLAAPVAGQRASTSTN